MSRRIKALLPVETQPRPETACTCSCPLTGPYYSRFMYDGIMTFYGYCLELWYDCAHSTKIVNVFTIPLEDAL